MIDVSSKQFYGEGYDDNDKRIPDMTIINRQLGWNPKTPLKDLLETTLTQILPRRWLSRRCQQNSIGCWVADLLKHGDK